MSRRRLAGSFVVLSMLLGGCGDEAPQGHSSEPPAVGVIEVTEQKVNPYFEFVGKTRAKETVVLRARVTGFLESRDFREGGDVDADQTLFKIEPERYLASLAQAEAELAAAQASLNRAEVDAARYEELAKAKNISQQKVDEAEAEVLVQEAAVQTAQAAIKQAQLDVDYTQVTAPIAGRIDVASYDVGNLVGPDSGVLATINMMDPINVAFSISETWYLELVKEDIADKRRRGDTENPEPKGGGDGAEEFTHVPLIRLPDGSLYEHEGSFDFFDNKVDEKTGTVLIRALFPNPDLLLLPGQFVTVVIERKEAKDAVVIPQAAVLTDQGGTYVLAVDSENKVESRRIETGQRFGPNLVVSEGLASGDRIVLYGVQKVRPGIEVQPELTDAPGDPMSNSAADSVMDETASQGAAERAADEDIDTKVPDRRGGGEGESRESDAGAAGSASDAAGSDSAGEDKPE